MSDFATTLVLRIDWSDLDAFGHVNNLAILRYTQTARLNYMEAIGMMAFHAQTGIAPVLASTSCQFRKELFYPGQVTVRTRVEQVKNTSLHMRHMVMDEAQACVAEALDILVMFDYRNHAKQPIPAVFREKLG